MVPLRKEAALDYHRMGSKIYCLGSDGSKGEYASKEMIQAHEGLFGMESQMWERIEENDLDYADEICVLYEGDIVETPCNSGFPLPFFPLVDRRSRFL